ncbi:hypothetical protein [Thermocrinis sp.]|jgi:hypothetical protein|uniref:hypothetical protein n=1 Tax=Thermocrinis sp. TaxID=2024383 RepID=UPI003BFAA044
MGKVKLVRYDATGKPIEEIEVDEECISVDSFGEKFSFRADVECEELYEKLRGGFWRPVLKEEEEEEEEEEDRWYRRRRRKKERNRRNRRRRKR